MFEYENNYIRIMHVIILRKVYSEYMYIYINLKSLATNLIGYGCSATKWYCEKNFSNINAT